ncbi:AAA-16 domain-containing protein [Mycena venus]|uniref:AAA-16 domain-containing protein n=1 Tax=Mycena venus TaxID=2733690 RepID=A0A8H6XR25_9AGAR|nr:AAA-16 domain-containing protein [Mycena venus]
MSSHLVVQTFDVVLDNAPAIFELAGDALSLLPVPGLALVVKGLSGIVDAGARVNDGTRRAFMEEVMALSDTLKKMLRQTRAAVQDAVGDEGAGRALIEDIMRSEALRLRVQTLKSTIDALGDRIKDLKGGPGISGFLKGIIYSSRNEDTLSDMKDRLARAIEIFTLEGQLSIETVLGDAIENAKEIRQALEKAEDEKVLDAIPRAEAGYRCVDELKSGFLDGTREELFAELDSWSTGEFPKQVYFLSGGAGLGKSSIAHRLCTRLDEPTLGASFFFGRGNIESTLPFFSTLAYQLAISQPTLRPYIIHAAREHHKRATMVYHRSLDDTLDTWAGDVSRYLAETISKMSPYRDFIHGKPQMLERLIHRAGGVFIFARIAVKFLDTNRNHPNPQEQFELLLSPVGGAGLSPLDALYLQVLMSAFPREELCRSPSRHNHLQSFLTVIALQLRSLKPDLIELLWPGLSKDDVVWMTDQLRSVLLMDRSGYVLPLHATFGEFLVDQNRCTDPLYRVNSSAGHAKLALGCITAFTFENMSAYLAAANGALLDQFIHYAKSNWDIHLGQAEVNDELKEHIEQLSSAQNALLHEGTGLDRRWCLCEYKAIAQDAVQISLEYAKSAAYSIRWWQIALESPNLRMHTEATLPNIEAEEIVQNTLRIFDIPQAEVVVTSSDIARYEAVHKELVERIRHENAQEAWFN